MLDRLLNFEEQLARLEALLLVFFVLLMLGLATYNVFYRNVLVPIQVSVITDADRDEAVDEPPTAEPSSDEASSQAAGDFDEEAGGFGGGFEDSEAEDNAAGFGGGFGDPADEDEAAADDDAAGFAGGFGDATEEVEPAEPGDGDDGADGFAGGFGGGFDVEEDEADDDGARGFGGGFDSPDSVEVAAEPTVKVQTEEEEVPKIVALVDWLKLEWIDVLLRQLVLVVGFLGAMLATRRRKHITIDALSKVIPEKTLHWVHVLTNAVSIVVCGFLVLAGMDLVQISLDYPKELMSWAMEWHFQLVFPIGFALLVFHFSIRLIESVYYALGKAEPHELAKTEEVEIL